LELEVKWPNDIYYDRKFKIGGILAKSSLMGSSAFLKIGVGFNLNNEYPTNCLNKILLEKGFPIWSPEEFVAKFLNHFELYISQLTEPNGVDEFLSEFKENWMHKY